MITVILTHEVKNFSEWQIVFDADEGNRIKGGLHVTGLYQSADDPNMVTITGECPSAEALTDFMSNPLLKAAMEKGGVIGIPEVKILNKV